VRSLFDDYGRGDGIAIREISFQNNGLHGSSGLSLTAHFVETLQGVQDGSCRLRNVWDSREEACAVMRSLADFLDGIAGLWNES
jgi:hypothetical protein